MLCSDVKQMFTFLSHKGIINSLEWLLKEMSDLKQYTQRGGVDRTPRKIKKNQVTLVVETGEIYWGKDTHEGYSKPTGGPDDVVIFNFADIRAIVQMDLDYTYSTVGKTTLKQKQGCPIGGILSSFYANLVCAKQEYEFRIKETYNREQRIYGIRQVDDLILWVAYEHKNEQSENEAQQILKEALDTKTGKSEVYCDGLTLEEEDHTETLKNGVMSFEHDFAGTVIT